MQLSERLAAFLGKTPSIASSAFVHPTAVVVGDVELQEDVSVWPHAVLRADLNSIRIGRGSNLQDGVIVHLSDDRGVTVGEHVTVGHRATLHACTVEDHCLIGMGATLLDGCVIGKGSLVGAHSLVTENTLIPPGSLVMGTPARVVRALTQEEIAKLPLWAEKYVHVARAHRARLAQTPLP